MKRRLCVCVGEAHLGDEISRETGPVRVCGRETHLSNEIA